MRIKLNRANLMPRFSQFLGNRTINFRMFECLVTCFLRVTVSLLCRVEAVSKIQVPIYHCLIFSKGRQIVRPFDRHSNETATVRKHVTKYKHMRKWMLVFLWKFENRGIKIAPCLLNLLHQIYQFTLILYGVGVPLWCWHFWTNRPCAVH